MLRSPKVHVVFLRAGSCGAGEVALFHPWRAQKDTPPATYAFSLETLTFLSIFMLWIPKPKIF